MIQSLFFALAALTANAATPDAGTKNPVPTLRDSVLTCTTTAWDSTALKARGWEQGVHWNLAARGQRAQEYNNPSTGGHLTLDASFLYYVACTTSADFAKPEDRDPVQAELISEWKLRPVALADIRLSRETEAYFKENGLAKEASLFSNGKYLFAFVQRQVQGRNILALTVVDPLAGSP